MYEFLRRTFLSGDPERIHEQAVARIEFLQRSAPGRASLSLLCGTPRPASVQCMGLTFLHPVGMAAGFDKDARCVLALQEMGFSYVEIGTVTPRPQPGNPRPRIWRFANEKSLVNALGFPGEGMEAVGKRLRSLRANGLLKIPVGVNLGKNFDTPLENAAADYLAVLESLYDVGDYFVANVSSPNTPGLRDLQGVESLQRLISSLLERSAKLGGKPLLVKIAPDLADDDILKIARFVRDSGAAGIVAGNTTIRRDLIPAASHLDRGGLSGPPLFSRTLEMLKLLRSELHTHQTVISVGGISNSAHVRQCLASGANLIQVYTSFIFLGLRCAKILTA